MTPSGIEPFPRHVPLLFEEANRTPQERHSGRNFYQFLRKRLVVIVLFYVLLVAATNGSLICPEMAVRVLSNIALYQRHTVKTDRLFRGSRVSRAISCSWDAQFTLRQYFL